MWRRARGGGARFCWTTIPCLIYCRNVINAAAFAAAAVFVSAATNVVIPCGGGEPTGANGRTDGNYSGRASERLL